ncbi:calcium-binding protein [Thermococcus sp. Bubb.Bath]|uniref:calcium-binding protein n=1 Tax=Thermococcus sp. Bubb.Bath TaxID=1638242 RepID=UPI00143A749F|nr:calcium-binding protein [Thermococcus sp. Bubb.Bath]NJF25222.1 calcium-binding protein [Thermococcus sp. Bubb.Bath]
MGKFTTLLLILILLGALYVYHTNPHIIDDLTRGPDNFGNSGNNYGNTHSSSPGPGTGGGGTSTSGGFKGSGWVSNGSSGSPEVYIGEGFAVVPTNLSYILLKDRNKDGKIDAIYLDTTGDGNYDTAYLDEDYNGKTDTWRTTFNGVKSYAWDITGDGIPDVYDSNGDGRIDAWDLNSDGVIDERDVDYDGTPDLHDYDFDGVFDEFEGNVTSHQQGNGSETSGTFTCPSSADEAYRLYMNAYDNLVQLINANASQEELDEAYDEYYSARECYESFSTNTTTATSSGGFGEIKTVTLDTEGAMAIKFSTGELKGSDQTLTWEDVDIMAEPWCVDYPALLGHWIDLGEGSLDELDPSEIPTSGYPTNEVSGEIKAGYVYVNRNSDGSLTAFELVSHEKTGDCSHQITIRYANLGGG